VAAASSKLVHVHWLGHSTVLIELDGVRMLTDPLLRSRVAHLRRSTPAPTPDATVDAVLISHGHHDHLDLPSLRKLPRSVAVVVPRGLGELVRKQGFADVREVLAGDELDFSGVRVRVTHAEHDERRAGSKARAAPVGYALLGTSRVFFAGDTDVFPGLEDLISDLDLALIPIWGWGASLGSGHLDPTRAADAVALLRPRFAVPIHWGTFRPFHHRAGARFLRDPVDAFAAAARERAPEVEVRVLEPGESLTLQS
jgi:L-ascorbate metabolism protein UlaG (beta-lactamase superfamily)